MALPKRRHSKARRDKKKTHKKLSAGSLAKCQHCQKMKKPHSVCPYCGYYKGKLVVEIRDNKKEKAES